MSDAIIDACCFINLYASGEMAHFFEASRWSWYVPRAVLRECLFIRVQSSEGADEREAVQSQGHVDSGLIVPVDIESAKEAELYVRLAADLDDGEAMALAIAHYRGWVLATDDRKARRIARDWAVETVTTPELMREWQRVARLPASHVRTLLANIESRGRFTPAEDAPDYAWWMKLNG